MLSEPRIVCAANRNNDTGQIAIGVRHFCPIMRQHMKLMGSTWTTSEQGFIDQHGNFHNRKEAKIIAEKNNQIFRLCGDDSDELFSENLY